MANLVIPDGGNIGSTSDTDAISISSSGAVTFSQDINPNNFVGMIAPFAMATPPTGWLACDGSTNVSKTAYADLYNALTANDTISNPWGSGDDSSTFALPDLEGAFLRGVGAHNTSNKADGTDFGDASRAVGSFEDDQFQDHLHYMRDGGNGSGSYLALQMFTQDQGGVNDINQNIKTQTNNGYLEQNSNGIPRSGDETRPFNAGVKYCIKY